MPRPTPTLLLILDGWGQAPEGPGNAVTLAATPTLHMLANHPAGTLLACSGREVGLPAGFMGNSEVGHLNIGAGRVVFQDIARIDVAIENGSFASNSAIASTMEAAVASGGALHLMALLSDGGVHSHLNHLLACIEAAKAKGLPVRLHLFMDGRDTAPTSGASFVRQLLPHCTQGVHIATLTGRYYAMDRDKRWERTALAWNVMVHGEGEHATDPVAALEKAYAAGITDEFIKPVILPLPDGTLPTVNDGDALFFLNFRADRARQITHAFADAAFEGFERGNVPALAAFGTMTAYEANLAVPCAFTRQDMSGTLGETVAQAGLRQLRLAETEKYAHVTYFFNGGKEEPFAGEDRLIVPSPKEVATYDQKPEMSLAEVTEKLLAAWNSGTYDLIVCNFANLDMVGHTGNIPAVEQACQVVDACVAKVIQAVAARNGRILITADHGNAEEMLTPQGNMHTAHSKNPVRLVVLDGGPEKRLRPGGKLGDIAPTLLDLWNMEKPTAMTGESLWEKA